MTGTAPYRIGRARNRRFIDGTATGSKQQADLAARIHRTLLAQIMREGYAVRLGLDTDKDEPDFVYSVGFPQSLGQPDVIVAGLDSELAHYAIDTLFRKCCSGLWMHNGMTVPDLLADYNCVLRAVHPDHLNVDYFDQAVWFERQRSGKPVSQAFQIVCPSAVDGRFPWEAGSQLVDIQFPLYEPRQAS